jgi:hypothetical protein
MVHSPRPTKENLKLEKTKTQAANYKHQNGQDLSTFNQKRNTALTKLEKGRKNKSKKLK